MEFQSITPENLAECVALFGDVFNREPWNESWETPVVNRRMEDCLHTPGFYGILAKTGDKAIGFAIGYIEQWDKSRHFYLKEMCIASEQQRCGMGTALMDKLMGDLSNQGVEKIYLHTARNTVAQDFYEKQGFYVSPKMIMMAKWLNQ